MTCIRMVQAQLEYGEEKGSWGSHLQMVNYWKFMSGRAWRITLGDGEEATVGLPMPL